MGGDGDRRWGGEGGRGRTPVPVLVPVVPETQIEYTEWSTRWSTVRTVAGDATSVYVDYCPVATNAVRDAARHNANILDKHDDATAIVWRAESVRADLLTRRGRF